MGKPDVSPLPYESSFVPEILTAEHKIKFACHLGVSCFNRFLRQALFGEKNIDTKQDAVNKRAEERKDYWQARHDAEMEYANLNDPRYDPEVMGDEVMRDDMLKEQQEASQNKVQEK